jgi:AbiV family abortive infection protein
MQETIDRSHKRQRYITKNIMTKITPQEFVSKFEVLLEGVFSGDEKKLLNSIKKYLDSWPSKFIREAEETIKKKDQVRRIKLHSNLINEALFSTKPLIVGNNLNEEVMQFNRLLKHAKGLWKESVSMLRKDNYPISIFLALVCIEESAKIAIAYMQILNNERKRNSTPKSQKVINIKKGKNPIYSHSKKHMVASFAGILVNSRADNRLGLYNINKFMEMAEKGEIENLRQSCLYADRKNNTLKIPSEIHDKKSAAFYVALAGEILSESDVVYCESLLKELDAFEAEHIGAAK